MLRILFFLLASSIAIAASAETLSSPPPEKPLTLSLNEAILLAVRENPNVQQSQLNEVMQKFALHVQQWQFQPHYQFTASRTVASSTRYKIRETSRQTFVQPSTSLLTPIGTQFTVTSINNISDHYNPGLSLEMSQPLMRGFGRPIVETALYNAMDSERISKLNIEGTLRTTVSNVIDAYLEVVSAENTVKNDEKALERSQLSVKQTELFIKAGHKAGNEVVTVQADVANAETTLENDRNSLQQSRYALLESIGLDPSTKVVFTNLNVTSLIQKYHIPSLADAEEMSLLNDIQYQVDQITFEGATKRALVTAEDNTRWQLDLKVKTGVGQGTGGGPNAGLNSLVNNVNRTNSAELTLQIPIDDEQAKQAVLGAKIAIREAAIALKQEKWTKQTNAINGWNTIGSAERALHFAENAARLQHETYEITYKKYLYGLIDSTALQSVQQQLISSDQSLVSARINYLKALVNLDLLTGVTLKTWKVDVRYS
jgi:outer membrane protein TolC